ncbi:hypothetical protein DVK85_09510 [Flavobacterium arcticum]|uniref:GIY-YIG domain-containing protein n=1 Tax=Flavobacterium arcticum TaxID=1784713 RepID=A0A345HCZ8_9FLAO|nr:hypothetical protein [Flavobacterium arcticum]AXG74458.1 hypothetical protein DVK85_09510 [Flavobacterium arcticum]KAF2512422.1 hypothetical protein E0W72_04155 [Flavobacterium arcticum]
MPQQVLKNSLNQLIENLNDLNETSLVYNSFTFSCNDLPIPEQEGNIYNYELYKELFDSLEENKKSPYIYWFEVKNDVGCIPIRNMVDEYSFKVREEVSKGVHKNNRKFYGVPAMTKGIKDINSKILYVGKVKSNLKGRLVSHFGYYHKSPNTQGLQLARWSKDKNIELEFHYIQLPFELEGLASLLEFKLAGELKPILGKHRG